MYKRILYKKAYRKLYNITPVKFDCGQICNKKCCNGNDEMGMILFPEEISYLQQLNVNFLNFRQETNIWQDINFAFCNGACNRKYRPLSCRIYPFTPYIDKQGILKIIKDPRAKYVCPLLYIGDIKINNRFSRTIKKVFKELIQDNEIREHIDSNSRILDEYARFTGDL
ncbi:MAG: hypothetical protein Q8942_12955 [Bacillota bacterium]|nr:hypothetical protein [Bacillota bacterium]